MRFRRPLAFLLPLIGVAHGFEFRLPTGNDFLLRGQPEKFYMYVDRNFEGQKSKPWQGGCYGQVRTPLRVGNEVVNLRFHEGIDIAPLQRDKVGVPLDVVQSVGVGTVVYVTKAAGNSNYGHYVVVAHDWAGGPYYSLYAHLAKINCAVGDKVKPGSPLGILGFTGEGIDKTRAHVHLELNLLLQKDFDQWHAKFQGGTNHHGLYNGMNLAGLNIADFYLARKKNPALELSDFIRAIPVYFKVTVPNQGSLDLAQRYPWMLTSQQSSGFPSWEISFSDSGLPLSIAPSGRTVSQPAVTYVKPSTIPHKYRTRNLVDGEGNSGTLSKSGRDLITLITGTFNAS